MVHGSLRTPLGAKESSLAARSACRGAGGGAVEHRRPDEAVGSLHRPGSRATCRVIAVDGASSSSPRTPSTIATANVAGARVVDDWLLDAFERGPEGTRLATTRSSSPARAGQPEPPAPARSAAPRGGRGGWPARRRDGVLRSASRRPGRPRGHQVDVRAVHAACGVDGHRCSCREPAADRRASAPASRGLAGAEQTSSRPSLTRSGLRSTASSTASTRRR